MALRPSFMRENVGHALGSAMTGSMELQAVMHHGPADAVVAGAPNSEMGDENIRL
jgi:hypothetical protein